MVLVALKSGPHGRYGRDFLVANHKEFWPLGCRDVDKYQGVPTLEVRKFRLEAMSIRCIGGFGKA